MKKGFTLIELIIVVGLVIMLSSLTLPVGFNFFQESTLRDQARNLESSLRKAQAVAISGRGDANAGIKIAENSYIIFEGSSYENRRSSLDIIIPFSISISPGGNDEIVFEKTTGKLFLPTEEALITLTFGTHVREISINSQGKIESLDS